MLDAGLAEADITQQAIVRGSHSIASPSDQQSLARRQSSGQSCPAQLRTRAGPSPMTAELRLVSTTRRRPPNHLSRQLCDGRRARRPSSLDSGMRNHYRGAAHPSALNSSPTTRGSPVLAAARASLPNRGRYLPDSTRTTMLFSYRPGVLRLRNSRAGAESRTPYRGDRAPAATL